MMYRENDPYEIKDRKKRRKLKYQIFRLSNKKETVYLHISEVVLKHKFEINVYDLSHDKVANTNIAFDNSTGDYRFSTFSKCERILSVRLKKHSIKNNYFTQIDMSVENLSDYFYKLNLDVKLSSNISNLFDSRNDINILLLLKFVEGKIIQFINDKLKIDTELWIGGIAAPVSVSINKKNLSQGRLQEIENNYDFVKDLNIYVPRNADKQNAYYICFNGQSRTYKQTKLEELLIIENILNEIEQQNYHRMHDFISKKLNSKFYRRLLINNNFYQAARLVINILLSEENLSEIKINQYLENKRKYLIEFKKYIDNFDQKIEKITQKQQKISESAWTLLNERLTTLGVVIALVALLVALCQWDAFTNVLKSGWVFITHHHVPWIIPGRVRH